MPDVSLTVDGKKLTAPAGTLLIEACKSAGIEVPSFCYYPNLSLQGACRMCVVKVEKMPKLQTACTTVVAEGMVVSTDSDSAQSRSDGGTVARESSARLSGLRCGRRVRTQA
jgi:NADH-quinone oxidoreductase subunit G